MLFRRQNLRNADERSRSLFEHEIDVPASLGPTRTRPHLIYSDDLRLIANPFLAVATLLLWGVVFRLAYLAKNFTFLILLLFLLPVPSLLLQFHCLDCGKTGSLFRWKSHACGPTIARSLMTGKRPWLRLPTPTLQIIVWGYFLAIVLLLTFIVRLPRS